MKVIFVVGIL